MHNRAQNKKNLISVKLISLLLLFLIGPDLSQAITINASSCSQPDLQAAINSSVTGDIIKVPGGTCVWNNGVSIRGKGITIQGSGSGRIVGRSTTSLNIATGALNLTTQSGLNISANQLLRVSQTGNRANFLEGFVVSYSGTSLNLNVTKTAGSGTHKLWLLSTPPTTTIINNSSANIFQVTEDTNQSISIGGIKISAGTGNGTGVYIERVVNGKPVLVHDCWIETNETSSNSIFTNSNRGVVWNCSFDSSPFSMAPVAIHLKDGPEDSWTTPSTMGTRDLNGTSNFYVESSDFHAFLNATDIDDNGRAVFRHNIFNNAGFGTHGADTSNFGQRHFEVYNNEFVFNGYSDGTTFNLNWWFYIRGGTGVIADNILPDIISQDYGDKGEINMTVMNLQRDAGPNPCWGANIPGNQYPAPRQVGMGRITGSAGNDSITYAGDSEPLYFWANSGNYSAVTTDSGGCTNPDSTSSYVLPGRDYFNGTPKPGYVKYPYPHPLTGISTPPTTQPLRAPTNLRVL